MLDERVHELGAAVDEDVAIGLPLQLGHLARDVVADHGRVAPLGVFQRRRDDVLGHRVHLVGEPDLVGPRRPGRGEPLVRLASEQKRVGGEDFVELELVSLGSSLELEGPASAVEPFASARIFHDPVQRDELRHDELSHAFLPSG